MSNKYFPVFIDINGYKILIIGGGNIAARRAKGLLEFGALVTVISPSCNSDMQDLQEKYPQSLVILERAYDSGDEEGYRAVLSCVDDRAVDQMIYDACTAKKIPVNIASDKSKNDFYFPALICDDDMVIGVCSGGKDHKKVARISQSIREKIFGNS